jgi:succinate dehydrogenase/fumarate reductase-like Fe-S protein
MSQELATVKVFRFDPKVDKARRYDVYQVPYQGLSVLGVLHYIREHCDGSLAFHYGCEGYQPCKCGACVALVNGEPTLCCSRVAEKEMVIEPHPKYEAIKDIAVDLQRVKKEGRQKAGGKAKIIINNTACNGCGDCVITCPVQVFRIRKGKAFSADEDSCCGVECSQCADYCQQRAITFES